MNMDSDQQSQRPFDIQSDSQPPQDKPRQRRLIETDKSRKTYKEIIKVGQGIDKPAKYDMCNFRVQEKTDQFDLQFQESAEWIQRNLGLDKKYEQIDNLLIHFKKGQKSLVSVHYRNLENKKITDKISHFLIQIRQWTTVIDLDGDFVWMKTVLVKGNGIGRCDQTDIVTFKGQILSDQKTVHDIKQTSQCMMLSNTPKSIKKILGGMKNGQKCQVQVSYENYIKFQQDQHLLKVIPEQSKRVKIEVEVLKIDRANDLFHDKTVIKRVVKEGSGNSRPLQNYQVRFSYSVFYKQQVIIQQKQFQSYLDQREFSKVIKKSLLRMNTEQVAEVFVYDASRIKQGLDYQLILNKLNQVPSQNLVYKIKLESILNGKQSYSMSNQQKLAQSKRKKKIALNLIQNQFFKKALSLLKGNALLFQFQKERSQQMTNDLISSFLNTSFCLLKLQQYKQLVEVCLKVIKLDQSNEKALLRLIFGYQNLGEWEKCLQYAQKLESLQQSSQIRKRVLAKKEKDEQRQKKLFGKMFS